MSKIKDFTLILGQRESMERKKLQFEEKDISKREGETTTKKEKV